MRPIVGPIPNGRDPSQYDRLRRRVLWTMPSGLYVVGSRAELDGETRRNLMTINWVTQLAYEPKLLGISVETIAVTHGLVHSGKSFSLCILARKDRPVVRKFTKPARLDTVAGTLNGFSFHEATTGAPILDIAVGYLDCEVRQEVSFESHTLFIGEIVDAGFLASEDTQVLRVEDTRMNYGG